MDPGIFARGVQARLPENSSDNVLCFFSPQLILQFTVVYPRFISKETIIFQGFRGGPKFSRGEPTFPSGSDFFQGWGGGGLNANLYRNPWNL